MRISKISLISTLCLLLLFTIAAKQPNVKVTGTFSSFEYHRDSGDLAGTEVFIFYARNYWVLYQESEGEPGTPFLVEAKMNGDKIEFSVPANDGNKRNFKGRITNKYLMGTFDGDNNLIKLPRKRSYWQ